jgi:Plasmid pRiA4b ORF-3-like protein
MPQYYDIEVFLIGIEPRIWRRFLLKKTATFNMLHLAIQDSCGWFNSHLFEFRLNLRDRNGIASPPNLDDFDGRGVPEATRIRLSKYFSCDMPSSIFYTYDFGDNWEHEVKLLGCVEKDEKFKRRLIGGERAFPPEDCGGEWGYEGCVLAARYKKNPKLHFIGSDLSQEDIQDRAEWMGDWEPEAFNLEGMRKYFDQ